MSKRAYQHFVVTDDELQSYQGPVYDWDTEEDTKRRVRKQLVKNYEEATWVKTASKTTRRSPTYRRGYIQWRRVDDLEFTEKDLEALHIIGSSLGQSHGISLKQDNTVAELSWSCCSG